MQSNYLIMILDYQLFFPSFLDLRLWNLYCPKPEIGIPNTFKI